MKKLCCVASQNSVLRCDLSSIQVEFTLNVELVSVRVRLGQDLDYWNETQITANIERQKRQGMCNGYRQLVHDQTDG